MGSLIICIFDFKMRIVQIRQKFRFCQKWGLQISMGIGKILIWRNALCARSPNHMICFTQTSIVMMGFTLTVSIVIKKEDRSNIRQDFKEYILQVQNLEYVEYVEKEKPLIIFTFIALMINFVSHAFHTNHT